MYCNSPDNIPAFVNIQCDITEQINCLKNEIADFKKSVN